MSVVVFGRGAVSLGTAAVLVGSHAMRPDETSSHSVRGLERCRPARLSASAITFRSLEESMAETLAERLRAASALPVSEPRRARDRERIGLVSDVSWRNARPRVWANRFEATP